MNPKLTDQAVSELPLSAARAELLEEIMSSTLRDETASPAPARTPRRPGRWVAPLAAAAAVAALASASVWWPGGDDPAGQPAGGPAAPPLAAQPPAPAPASLDSGHLAVLDAPGWTVGNVQVARTYGALSYEQGQRSLEITWYPASSYADYVTDREHISDPPAPGAPVRVLGLDGQLWSYGPRDHTVMRKVQDGHWMEFRASGFDRPGFLALLDELRLVDQAGLEAALPEEFVTESERDGEISALLEEIRAVSGAGLPDGAPAITSTETDPYHLGADVAGGYACRWIAAYADATASGDDKTARRATEVLGTARQWPVLRLMADEGGYSSVVWGYADDVADGRVPEGYEGGLGC